MTAPSPSNQQRAAEVWRHRLVSGSNKGVNCACGWTGRGADHAAHMDEVYRAALDEAEARGRAEGLEQGRGDLEAWQRTCRAEGRAEAAAKIEALTEEHRRWAVINRDFADRVGLEDVDHYIGMAHAQESSCRHLRALAADLTAPADRSQP